MSEDKDLTRDDEEAPASRGEDVLVPRMGPATPKPRSASAVSGILCKELSGMAMEDERVSTICVSRVKAP